MTVSDFETDCLADWGTQETPIGRWNSPAKITNLTVVRFIEVSSIQGEIIKIDDGWSLK